MVEENEKYNILLQKFNEKGWGLYARERNGRKLEVEDMTAAKELQENIKYLIWPKGFVFGDRDVLEPFVKKHGELDLSIEVPEKVYGSIIHRFGKGKDKYPDPLCFYQGQRIDFIGLILKEEDIQLFRESETHINLDDFVKALDSLADISKLVA